MKIEFASIGDGTNIQVSLIEMLGDSEVIKDRFYTAQHSFPLCMVKTMNAEEYVQTFYDLEEVMSKPIIGGCWSHLHPYWAEREERRKRRLQNLE
jgi:hypothetical protein